MPHATVLESTTIRLRMSEPEPLIARIAQGDQAAFARLYDDTSRLVYGLVLRMVHEPSAAEDVTLEVYMQVWRTASSYQASRGSVTAWLATAARTRALDWMRSRQGRLYRDGQAIDDAPELIDAATNPEEELAARQRTEVVRKAIAALPTEQREALNLGFYAGLTQSEIAERLELPLGTVKSRMRMGMIKLREALKAIAEGQA
jgi:RNA polymerase sigma-70 factor, ECF subfamily